MHQAIRTEDDGITRAEVAEALINHCAHAHRQPCAIGTADLPTAWDRAHAELDRLLTQWEQAR